MKKTILITGGPVHAHIDAVKIVTNNFKGGRMAQFADDVYQISTRDVYGDEIKVILDGELVFLFLLKTTSTLN